MANRSGNSGNSDRLHFGAPNDELIALTVKFIEDPIFMQCVHIWAGKDVDVKRQQGLSHRFFRITGTDEEIQAKLAYMKMVI